MSTMKKMIAVFTLAIGMTAAGAERAWAGDEGWAAFGGFLGGTILANLGHDHHRHHTVRETHVVEDHSRSYDVVEVHYTYVDRRVWHEGSWSYEYDQCGQKIKTWHPGYYTVERIRVKRPSHRNSHGRSHYARCRY